MNFRLEEPATLKHLFCKSKIVDTFQDGVYIGFYQDFVLIFLPPIFTSSLIFVKKNCNFQLVYMLLFISKILNSIALNI